MIFIKKSPDENFLFNKLVSQNNLVEIGTYRVMFGYRVRAGFCNNSCVNLDWCAGDDWENIQRLYSIALSILSKRNEDKHCFEGLPMISKIKPFFLDNDFTSCIIELAGQDCELVNLERH